MCELLCLVIFLLQGLYRGTLCWAKWHVSVIILVLFLVGYVIMLLLCFFSSSKKVSSRVILRMLRSDLAEYHTGMSLEDAIKYIRNPPKKFGRYAAHVVNVLN